MKELAGKTAVVTGAASGIGRAMAERFLEEGMNVVLADIDDEALRKAEHELAALGTVAAMLTDVSRAESVQALADFAVRTFGHTNVLCNNAGVGIGGAIWEHTAADWEWLLSVNVLGVANGIHAFVPLMLSQGDECHIVNTASAAGLDARPWLGMYSATKYAVVAISEALQADLRLRGSSIGVSVVCPALVNTRIAESERNRPPKLGAGEVEMTPDAKAFDDAFRAALAQGLPPAQVAEAVIEAVKNERFYIITQAETEARVRSRFERILNDAATAAV
jgi:NADP-dependent 3-hydroxy acid dehydrogenase YdfG